MNGPWPHGDPQGVVRAILAQPAFRNAVQRPGEKTWIDYLLDAVGKAWKWFTEQLSHVTGNTRVANVVALVVLVAVLVFLAIVVARFLRGTSWRLPAKRSVAGAEALGTTDARALLARALEAAAAGRHHEAAALLWASALHGLAERGRVRYDAARTPDEWRRAVRDPHFDAFARDAVLALFGDQDADATLVARMRAAYERFVPA